MPDKLKASRERAIEAMSKAAQLRRELDIENRRLQKRASLIHDRMVEQSTRLRGMMDPDEPDSDTARAYQLAANKRASAQQVLAVLKQIEPTLKEAG